jgi:hypothetical protein
MRRKFGDVLMCIYTKHCMKGEEAALKQGICESSARVPQRHLLGKMQCSLLASKLKLNGDWDDLQTHKDRDGVQSPGGKCN